MYRLKVYIGLLTIVSNMSNTGKDRITVSISPYVKAKLKKYVGKGEGKRFSSESDAANTALIELFYRIEQKEEREDENEHS